MVDWFPIFRGCIMWTSIVCITALFTLYLIFKALRTHPGELLMIASFCCGYWMFSMYFETGMFYSPTILNFINYFFGNKLTNNIKQIVFRFIPISSIELMANALLYYQMIICLDLALTIYMPLTTPSNRNKFYHLGYLFVFILIYLFDFLLPFINEGRDTHDNLISFSDVMINDFFFGIYFTIILSSLIYFVVKIRRAKLEKRVIKVLLIRYFIYGTMSLIYFLLLISEEFSKIYAENNSGLSQSFATLYLAVQFTTFSILRITEPYTWDYIQHKLKYHLTSVVELKKKHKMKIVELEDWLRKTPSLFIHIQTKLSAQLVEYMLRGIISATINKNPEKRTVITKRQKEINKRLQDLDINNNKNYFKFNEYLPEIFSSIRNSAGLTNKILLDSLDPNLNKSSLLRVTEGEGKSGSFFFFTHDKRFIIKIIQLEDKRNIRKMIKNFAEHLKHNPKTLLLKIYSMFNLKVKGTSTAYAILVSNAFYMYGKVREMEYIFDLKGSKLGRYTIPVAHKKRTLKDENFIRMNKQKQLINIERGKEKSLHRKILADIIFLSDLGFMDYSLLLGIGKEKGVYSFSIIDYNQKYNWKKKFEHYFKTVYNPANKDQMSSIDQRTYYKRFIKFIISITSRDQLPETPSFTIDFRK